MIIGKRIKLLREQKGLTQGELAKRIGGNVKQQNIGQLEDGTVNQPRYLHKLLQVLGVTYDELMTKSNKNLALKNKTDSIIFPMYDQKFSMGNGESDINQDVQIRHFETNMNWVKQNLKQCSHVDNVCIITGKGNSMSGTIEDGSAVFIDTGATSFAGDNIYALRASDDDLLIKRVLKLTTGSYLLVSDNEKYPSEECKEIKIIGRVVGAMNFNQL